jgi:hypothetical protein
MTQPLNQLNRSTLAASSYPDAQAMTDSTVTGTLWGIAIAWFVVALAAGASGFTDEYKRFVGPLVIVPLAVFATAFSVSARLRAWALTFDPKMLVSFQALRIGGGSFLAVYAVGKLSGTFAIWAGSIDVATGLSALVVAYYLVPARTAMQRRLLIAWMAFGIVDFFVAVPLARIARSQDPAAMIALSRLPLCMITTYFVPLALIAYFILGAQLWQQRGQTLVPHLEARS